MRASWWIFGIGLLYGLSETAYFGWNMLPSGPMEVVCDGIGLVIAALSGVASAIERRGG